MKVSPPRARPWNDMREIVSEGLSQNGFDGSVTLSLKLSDKETVRLEIEHARLREIGEWLIQCANRQPMLQP